MTTLAPGQPTARLRLVRQPILEPSFTVHGHEVRYAVAGEQTAVDHRAAAQFVARSLLGLASGTDATTRLYVPVPLALVQAGSVELPESDRVVLQLPAPATAQLAPRLAELRARGHRFALDGYTGTDDQRALLPQLEAVKIPLSTPGATGPPAAAAQAARSGVSVIVTGVDTSADAARVTALGADYLQGTFYAEPLTIERRQAPGVKHVHARLLAAIREDELDLAEIEHLVKSDVFLVHQFLRYLNSAAFGWRQTVTDVRHALVLLGADKTRSWVLLVVLADLGRERPPQLAVAACLRARLCEAIGSRVADFAQRKFDLFSLGMFSLLDALLGQRMAVVLGGVPLAKDVRAALLGTRNPLRTLLDVVLDYEQGDWPAVDEGLRELGLTDDAILDDYLEAVEWVGGVLDASAR